MPTVTAEQIDQDQREATARVKIAEALRDAQLTPIQSAHLLATMLAEHTQRLTAWENRKLDEIAARVADQIMPGTRQP